MIVKLQFRLGTGAEWDSKNPVLDDGEPGYDTTAKAFKVGDGSTPWVDLNYHSSDPAMLTQAIEDAAAAVTAAETAQAAAEQAATEAQEAAQAATVLPTYTTVERPDPTIRPGQMIFDTTLDKPLVTNGTRWEDMAGNPV